MLHFNASQMKVLASSLVMALGLGACAPQPTSSLETSQGLLDLASVQASGTLLNVEKAERMSEAAERLLAPGSFMYSYEIAEAALVLDPENRKARFIRALLAPNMELKGILTRIEPLVKTQATEYAKFKQFTRQVKRLNPETAATRFLFDGVMDIQTEREFQEVIARFTAKLDELRLTVKDLKNGPELTLFINDEALKNKKDALSDAINTCLIKRVQPLVFDISKCDLSRAYEVRLNRADFEAVQQITAGYQVYLTILNGWDLSGVYSKSHILSNNPDKAFELLLEDKNFGVLRSSHGFGAIPETAHDAIMGIRYALDMEPSLCPRGSETPGSRPGHLFPSGICLQADSDIDATLVLIEKMLQGPVEYVFSNGPMTASTTVDPFALVKNPIQDVRTQLPVTTDACGQITQIADDTAVLIVYLRWSIRTKPWYFVPVKLDTLSQSHTGLPFYSDQIARNTKDSVYIDAAEYTALPSIERARLLMHEMVMSARFLMKQTPQAQCLALSRSRDLAVCKDEVIMKTGVDIATSDTDRETLTAGEHERVRLMTNFLMDEKKNSGSEEVRAMRIRLGFHFPWDSMISDLQLKDFEKSFKRAEASGDRFQAVGPSFLDSTNKEALSPEALNSPRDCFLVMRTYSFSDSASALHFQSYIARGLRPEAKPLKGVIAFEAFYQHLNDKRAYTAYTYGGDLVVSTNESYGNAAFSIKIKGVRRADLSQDILDHITIQPQSWNCQSSLHCRLAEFYVARSPQPRILEYKITPVVAVDDHTSGILDPQNRPEYVPIFGQDPLVCRLADRI